jgi:hypothetical protein
VSSGLSPIRHDAAASSHRQRGRRPVAFVAAVIYCEPLESLVMPRSGFDSPGGSETVRQGSGPKGISRHAQLAGQPEDQVSPHVPL